MDFVVFLQIFSVVNAIVYVKVFVGDRCLNDELVKEKLAEVCEESYLSKVRYRFIFRSFYWLFISFVHLSPSFLHIFFRRQIIINVVRL